VSNILGENHDLNERIFGNSIHCIWGEGSVLFF